jgi:iron(III) transport system permease protein
MVKTPAQGVFAFLRPPRAARLFILAIAFLVLVPIAVIVSSLTRPETEILGHLANFVLPGLLTNTFWLILGVGIGVALLGTSLAWFTAVYAFPGRAFFSWALLLPLALPAYVSAFVAIGLLDFTGPVQTALRGIGVDLRVLEIRSRGGVIAVMVLALYPYVYLIARNAFLTQGRAALETAQSLGLPRWKGFFLVALPMARPWIAAGVTLALMETLADFGTVSVFNYDTFTTAIYKAWFSLFSLPAASQLASLLILFVFVLALIEQRSRNGIRYGKPGRGAEQQPLPLPRVTAWAMSGFAGLVLLLAFIVPLGQLGLWALQVAAEDLDARYWQFVRNSLLLSAAGAILVTLVALGLAYAARAANSQGMAVWQRLASLGYAVPGTVLAVGIFIPVAWLDNQLINLFALWQKTPPDAVLKGTLVVMLLAYLVRFLAVGSGPLEAGLQRITRSIDDAGRSLGLRPLALLTRLHLPMLRGSLGVAMALAFVDIMKEMPITLMTRPFGWDTLAVRVFEMTSEGEWERAALPSLAIVLAGLVPVIFITRRSGAH